MPVIEFKPYQLRVISAWLVNLSAGWFASSFLVLQQPAFWALSIFVSLTSLFISGIIEKRLDEI